MCCIRIVRPRPSSVLVQAGMHMVVVKRCETIIEIAQITSGWCTWPVELGGVGENILVLAYCVVCWGSDGKRALRGNVRVLSSSPCFELEAATLSHSLPFLIMHSPFI